MGCHSLVSQGEGWNSHDLVLARKFEPHATTHYLVMPLFIIEMSVRVFDGLGQNPLLLHHS